MHGRVIGSVDCGLEVGTQVVWRRADWRLVHGRHVGVRVVRVDAVGAGVALLARGGGCRRGREITVVCLSAGDVWRAVREHVGRRDQSNRRRDLGAVHGLAVAVTGSATHGNRGDVGFGLLATQGESACERHVAGFEVA